MNVVVIDGQSGRMGQLFIERAKGADLPCEITAVGTNAIATAAMLKAGAGAGATGENPVLVACRTADVIVGPIGILAADALYGRDHPCHGGGRGAEPREKAAASGESMRQSGGRHPVADPVEADGRSSGAAALPV